MLSQLFDSGSIGGLLTQFQAEIGQPQFWLALTKIIWINVLLSGDNALVIALACRGLQPRQRLWGMVLGAAVAVLLRVIFTGVVASLMGLPFLKLIGGLALIVIAAKLLVPEEADEDSVQAAQHLWSAVRIVAVADIIMSLDNVIAVAAAANGSVVLLVLSLVISVPLIVAGAALIMAVLDRAPVLVWLGAALLGWIAGDVIATDPIVHPILDRLLDGRIALNIDANSPIWGFSDHLGFTSSLGEFTLAVLGVVLVLLLGMVLRRRALKAHSAEAGVTAETASISN